MEQEAYRVWLRYWNAVPSAYRHTLVLWGKSADIDAGAVLASRWKEEGLSIGHVPLTDQSDWDWERDVLPWIHRWEEEQFKVVRQQFQDGTGLVELETSDIAGGLVYVYFLRRVLVNHLKRAPGNVYEDHCHRRVPVNRFWKTRLYAKQLLRPVCSKRIRGVAKKGKGPPRRLPQVEKALE